LASNVAVAARNAIAANRGLREIKMASSVVE
jgi:hypothetical protein